MGQDERFDIVIVGGGHNGTTIAAYLAKCGLSVCILEERPELEIKEIGEIVGYPDQGYFSRVFKRASGSSPLDYREGRGRRRE